MKTKLMSVLLCAAVMGAMTVSAFAAERNENVPGGGETSPLRAETSETLHDQTHRYPIEVNGEAVAASACVMIPLRAVAEPLGFTVTWDNGSVLVDNGIIHTKVTIGVDRYVITTSREDLVGMSAPFSLGAAPYVVEGVTYVPLGLIHALLGNQEGTVTLDGNKISIQTKSVELANPFVSCETLEEAERIAGFSLELPGQLPDWIRRTTMRAVGSAMIEVTFEGQDRELVIRKGTGSQDISGDYNVYDSEKVCSVDGCRVVVRGTGGKAAVAVWTRDGYTYAVNAEPGVEPEMMTALAAAVR
jgi:hypothetical protein